MTLKLWVDHENAPPDDTWEWVTTSEAAIATLEFFSAPGMLWCPREAVSFNSDLRAGDTVRPVVEWMVENRCKFDSYSVHGGNTENRIWILRAVQRLL